MATLDDILTAQKNGVVAINTLNQTWLTYDLRQHAQYAGYCDAETLVATGSGYITSVSVLTANEQGAAGFVFDSSTGSGANEQRRLAIPQMVGVHRVDMPFRNGITVKPGDGQIVVVCYSLN